MNDRVVAIEDRCDAEFAETGPGKYVFHNDRAGNQLRNRHANGGHARLERILEHMFDENRTFLESADACVKHIVFTHVFEHVVADQADIGRNVG